MAASNIRPTRRRGRSSTVPTSASRLPAPVSNSPPATTTSQARSAWRGIIIDTRRPCLVRNCAREQGPITTGLEDVIKASNTFHERDAAAYGSLLSQGRLVRAACKNLEIQEKKHVRPPQGQARFCHCRSRRHRPRLGDRLC